MYLTTVILLAVGLSLLTGFVFWAALSQTAISQKKKYPPLHLIVAVVATLVVVYFMSVRSLGFGVDTATYADLFTHYCNGGSLDDYKGSFWRATVLLNGIMLGQCKAYLIPAAWIVAIVIPMLAMRTSFRVRMYFLVALFTSLIGIELATNALRQGLSVGFMVLAVSFGRQRPLLMLLFASLSVLLHYSAALFFATFLLSQLGWKTFITTLLTLIALTVSSLDTQVTIPLAADFIYELKKYSTHEADEFWIRVLSFACIISALVAPLLSREPGKPFFRAFSKGPYAVALRLGICCLPFLSLPYFGYRFIYGVYPVLLLMTLIPNPMLFSRLNRQFGILCVLNLLILLTWSAGSSYMREIPFV